MQAVPQVTQWHDKRKGQFNAELPEARMCIHTCEDIEDMMGQNAILTITTNPIGSLALPNNRFWSPFPEQFEDGQVI